MNTPRHQRGAMALTMAILLIGLISILSVVTVAQYYWAKRDAQKVADMAALSGAQHFKPNCGNPAIQAATDNASNLTGNWGETTTDKGIDPTCGNWNPATNASAPNHTYFIASSSTSATPNAIKVTAYVTPSTIIPERIAGKAFKVKATAIAAHSDPVAAFSVGSQLLELHENGVVPGLLKVLGLDVGGTTLAGYKGLANLRITPAGLLQQLHIPIAANADVGTLNSVLAAHKVNVADLINAVADIANQQQLANTTVTALRTLAINAQAQGGKLVQLGTAAATGQPRGLFAYINTATVQSALDAKVDALDILNTSLQVANSQHLIDLTNGTLPGVTLLGGVKVFATVIEPPSIAIGGPGVTAYTSQVRLGLKITTKAIPMLGPLLTALGTNINIPIIIDVVTGQGTLKSLCDHDADGHHEATIHASSTLLNVCISEFDPSTLGSTSQPCQKNLQSANLITALGIPLVQGDTHIWGFTSDPDPDKADLDLLVGQTKSINVQLNLGTTVDNIMTGVLQLLAGQSVDNSSGTQTQPGSLDSAHLTQLVDNTWTNAGCNGSSNLSDRKACMDTIKSDFQGYAAGPGTGLLPGLVNLVGGLVDSLGNLLLGNGCTTTLLGIPGGSVQGCKNMLTTSLDQTQTAASMSNALVSIVAPVLNLLQPVLDTIGQQLLQPLVKLLLGDDIGRTDVHLMSLQCSGAHLVY